MSTDKKVTKNPIRGQVVTVSQDTKTAKVEVLTIVPDKMYGKYMRRHTAIHVDTAGVDGVVVGKNVNILPCRPVSKTKSWKVVSVASN